MGKVKFKYGMNDVHANLDELIVYYSKYFNRNIARTWVQPKESEANRKFTFTQANVGNIWAEATDAYKRDFRIYAEFLASQTEHRQPFYSLFLQMMWNWKKLNPANNLETLSRQQILDSHLPMQSVAAAVEAGLLLPVLPEGIGDNSI